MKWSCYKIIRLALWVLIIVDQLTIAVYQGSNGMFTSDDSDTDTGKNASKAGDKNDTGNGADSKTVGGKYTHLRSIRTNFPLMITY